ncbi:MAG: DUF5615 family PIN-like protein [Nitrospirae bacterium]|nr:DUF5615 family PIN-like protein [Nitrospirota bacterium]
MKIIADENLFAPIVNYLESLCNDVLSVRDANLSGISDDEVYEIACREKRIIVTMDKDFTRILRFSPRMCGGIVVVKIYKRRVDETLEIFENYFSNLSKEDLFENLVSITPDCVRIKRSKNG